jgi:1-deoxy-D-xylulose-5-phosphate reductoisomerase
VGDGTTPADFGPERIPATALVSIREPDVLHSQARLPAAGPLKPLLVLGSTGSIGRQTLELVREQGSGLAVAGLAAHTSWEELGRQIEEFRPPLAALIDPAAANHLRPHLPPGTRLLSGPDALVQLVEEARFEVAVHGVVGRAGLEASFAVARTGKTLALANKESLVIAGELLIPALEAGGSALVPVDSEHSAIAQCLRGEDSRRIRKVLLTASGGPFRTATAEDIAAASVEQALAHPNWSMGPRITIGSATLMNKTLEVLEVHHLFGLPGSQIEVVVHPQSIVHSMVEFCDGSVVAQLGPPDMRGPIHYAVHHPDRAPANLTGFDLATFSRLDFEAPDLTRFPALGLGYRCIERGGSAGCVLNAADEVAVAAFLEGRIPLPAIAEVVEQALEACAGPAPTLESLQAADEEARRHAEQTLAALSPTA